MKQWGYIRETKKGVEKETTVSEVGYTPLLDYLNVIFPETNDWIHNKSIKDDKGKALTSCHPDYHSPSLKIVIEFDGILHYQKTDQVLKDAENNQLYESLGYTVIRIPYFIQLSKTAIRELFGINLNFDMFDENKPSFGVKWRNTPAYVCVSGLKRMAKEFHRFPSQYQVNLDALKNEANQELAGTSILESFYNANKG